MTGIRLRSVDCYDPVSDTWASLSDMIIPRMGHGLLFANDKLYAVGGAYDVDTIEEYDPKKDEWRILKDKLVCNQTMTYNRSCVIEYSGWTLAKNPPNSRNFSNYPKPTSNERRGRLKCSVL